MARRWVAWTQRGMGLGLLVIAMGAAAAGGTCKDFLKALGQRESGMNPSAHNPYGYVGLFQMGEAALIDAGYYRPDGTGRNDWRGSWTGKDGITSLETFKASPALQAKAIEAYHARIWGYIRANGLDRFIGSTVGGIEITRSGLIGGAHLVGTGGLARFLNSSGRDTPRDAFGTTAASYVAKFGGYELTGAGADCSAVMGGSDRGGVAYTPPPPSATPTPSTPFYAPGLATDRLGVDEAFYSTAGVDSYTVSMTIRLLLSGLLMLIAAWAILASWWEYAGGLTHWYDFMRDNQRVMVLTSLVLVLIVL